MKKLLFASVVLIVSCNSDVPKCSDEVIVDRLKAMIVENMERKQLEARYGLVNLYSGQEKDSLKAEIAELENKIVEENIERKNNLQIINIVTAETNNENKSCSCEATLDNVAPVSIYLFQNFLENGQNINYSVKTTDDGEKIIEIAPIY